MSGQEVMSLVVQGGAVGLCALLIYNVGKKLDALASEINRLVARLEVLVEQHRNDHGGMS